MKLGEQFAVRYGNQLDLNKMTLDPQGVIFVGRSGRRNGIAARVEEVEGQKMNEAGLLTVALGGAVLSTFVQQEPFLTAQNVAVLEPMGEMNVQEKLYWAACIQANRFRYAGYGREANRTLGELEVPDEVPEWVQDLQVPDFVGALKPQGEAVELPPIDQWGEWRLDELFDVRKGTRLTKADMTPGPNRYIGASDSRNGVTHMVGNPTQFQGHALTVPYNGSIGFACYQPDPFLAGDDVHVLITRSSKATREALLMACAVIRQERFRYSYGRKWNLERMKPSVIRLPSAGEEPDWGLLDAYARSLPASGLLEVPEDSTGG